MSDAPPGATHLAKQSTGGLSTARHSFTDTEQEALKSCPTLPKVLPFLENFGLLPSKKVKKTATRQNTILPSSKYKSTRAKTR